MGFLLEILIPTYNRGAYLEKNINLLLSMIEQLNIKDKVQIIVSNNASTDNTVNILQNFHNNLIVYTQDINIGLEENAVFVLRKSSSKFSMFLGDDDFISKEYLEGVIKYIENDYYCIIPAIQAIDVTGIEMGEGKIGRDLGVKTSFNDKGYDGALKLFEKGHQLSGVTFLRDGTLESYIKADLRNIHPFMYFVGFNCLRGKSIHFTLYPILVTLPPQNKKDWGYGDDGLLIARLMSTFAVFRKNNIYLNKAQKHILYIDRGYGYKFLISNSGNFFNFLSMITRSKYCTVQNKFYFLYLEFGFIIKKLLKNALNR